MCRFLVVKICCEGASNPFPHFGLRTNGAFWINIFANEDMKLILIPFLRNISWECLNLPFLECVFGSLFEDAWISRRESKWSLGHLGERRSWDDSCKEKIEVWILQPCMEKCCTFSIWPSYRYSLKEGVCVWRAWSLESLAMESKWKGKILEHPCIKSGLNDWNDSPGERCDDAWELTEDILTIFDVYHDYPQKGGVVFPSHIVMYCSIVSEYVCV